jgi:Ca-activated chloride channel family protein
MKRLQRATLHAGWFSLLACLLIVIHTPSGLAQQTQATALTSPSCPEDGSVVLTVTVTNKKGAYITKLDKSSFTLYEDKAPQEITFFSEMDEPLSVGFVFDASASMSALPGPDRVYPEMTRSTAKAISRFIQLSNSSNIYFLIGFSQEAELLSDWTRNASALVNSLATVRPKGNTALYDACYLSVGKIMEAPHAKRVLVLITDGLDNASTYKLSKLRKLVRQSDVLVYSVRIPHRSEFVGTYGEDTSSSLNDLAKDSGGDVFYPEDENQLAEAFELLAAELRHQYLIGIKPTAPPGKEKWHKVKLTLSNSVVNAQELRARTREGYYTAEKHR